MEYNHEEKKELELRMYFFVPYNLSPIQQAIQAGHAALEYAWKYKDSLYFRNFITNWKTWIILNGGTTNEKRDFSGKPKGTLDEISDELLRNNISFSWFHEPDLNDSLTAVCFICDERVWNHEDYPDFLNYLFKVNSYMSSQKVIEIRMMDIEEVKMVYEDYYMDWVELMGGQENIFLRDLIRDKRLA